MTWLDMAVSLMEQFEDCRLQPYPDPTLGWDLPTIGYG
jgi:GH24 family phage-related lysozyme (muramidase)